VGQFVREVALYWLAYEITGSAWALGILGFCEAAPRLLLGAVGGVRVDRYDRLRLLTGIQFLCSLPVFGLVVLYFLGVLEFWHMALLEIFWATMRSMNPTAGQSILRDLVPEAELMSAVSHYSIGFNFARIVGPSIGGVLILWIGVGGCLIFYGVCLLLSGLELLGVRIAASSPLFTHSLLLFSQPVVVGFVAGIVRRHADHFSHRQPAGDSGRSAAGAFGASDERVFDGSRNALARLGRYRWFRYPVRRCAGLGGNFGDLYRVNCLHLLSFIVIAETSGEIKQCSNAGTTKCGGF
jgi:hypothetical protein